MLTYKEFIMQKREPIAVVYREIPNISPGLIEIRKPFWGAYIRGGLIFGGHFVLVSEYQDLKNHCFI